MAGTRSLALAGPPIERWTREKTTWRRSGVMPVRDGGAVTVSRGAERRVDSRRRRPVPG